jgi:predicted ATPase
VGETGVIRTPEQRVRVFVSSTLGELAAERQAVRDAVTRLRLVPVMFEMGARPHPPRDVYRAYLAQSDVFVGVYWQRYGWVAPGEEISGLEDEYLLSAGQPRLVYVKSPAPGREPRLAAMLDRIRDDAGISYKPFGDPAELQRLVENDLAVLLSERFEMTRPRDGTEPAPPAGSLPAPATPIVGREQEIAAVGELILRDGVRLVTLTGPGGVGKSRLALAAAYRLGRRFEDGPRFVGLASVSSAGLVPAAIASGLGLSTSGGRLVSDMTSYLRSKRILLLIDNFEHLTDTAPLLAELLAAAPGLVALVTSRSALRLSGEHELPVAPLAVPSPGAGPDGRDTGQYPSVRLFVERARAVAPDFALTSANAGAVAEICRRLDGLPLAIVLAAARVKMLLPGVLLARLDDRMRVLTGGARDLPERQRTLKNTLDWSFDLLAPDEQALFARLGVFSGTFDLAAAEAVCGEAGSAAPPGGAGPIIDMLTSLVESSLVQSEPTGEEPRFRLLETIREYALERMRERGGWKEMHDRHAAYFRALAEPAESEHQGAGQLRWLDRLEAEHSNLLAALDWLADQDQLGPAVYMAWATWRFWWLRGHAGELAQYADSFVGKSDRLPPSDRALALAGAGFAFITGGDREGARPVFEQSLQLYHQTGNTLDAALAAAGLGHVLASTHEYTRAREVLEQTLVQLRAIATGPLTVAQRVLYLLDLFLAENFLGQIDLSQGDHEAAARHFADGLSAARAGPDRFTILVSLYDLAQSSQARGDLARAEGLLEQGRSLAAEAGDKPTVAYYLEALAAVAGLQDEQERAACLLTAAEALLQANGSGWMHAYVPRAPHGNDVLAALRSSVGVAAFQRARARGRAFADAGAA